MIVKPHSLSNVVGFKCYWVCPHFCPKALAEALKVNTTVTKIDLKDCSPWPWSSCRIGNEGAKAWCLARGSETEGLETVNENRIKWGTSGVGDL